MFDPPSLTTESLVDEVSKLDIKDKKYIKKSDTEVITPAGTDDESGDEDELIEFLEELPGRAWSWAGAAVNLVKNSAASVANELARLEAEANAAVEGVDEEADGDYSDEEVVDFEHQDKIDSLSNPNNQDSSIPLETASNPVSDLSFEVQGRTDSSLTDVKGPVEVSCTPSNSGRLEEDDNVSVLTSSSSFVMTPPPPSSGMRSVDSIVFVE